MASKIGKILKTDSQSRVLFVDPNPKEIITPEQLSINVELKTFKKNRTAIELVKTDGGVNAFVNTGSEGNIISFINGSKLDDPSSRSLTTHYTELNTDFNKQEDDLETLGIKDIQIEFNSSNVPLVKINFVDVRGKLFEMGNSSPYNVFFELPFPIFELTVKGYYGGAVTYKLHLLKFNGSFNSSAGTFEIKCEFVGYTYAFLSDILIAYLKAIPYTEKGSRIVNELNSQDDFNFLTFDELDEGVKTLQSRITGLKEDNTTIKALAKGENKIVLLENFRDSFFEFSKVLAGGDEKIIGPVSSDNIILTNVKSLDLNSYNSFINNFFEGDNNDNDSLDDYKLTQSIFKVIEGTNLFRHVKKSDFINENGTLKLFEEYLELKDGRQLTPAQENKVEYARYSSKIQSVKDSILNDNEITVIDFKKAIDEINNTLSKIRTDSAERINELGEEFEKQIRESFPDEAFNSSIGDFFKILCTHVDIFLDVLRSVAVDAEKKDYSPFRNEQLRNLIPDNAFVTYNGGTENGGLSTVKAFPEYRVADKETGALEERWIGTLAPNMPEVLFVEDLLNGIIKSAQRDKKTDTVLNDNKEIINQWYPINPFDISLYNNKNPYEVIGETGKDSDIIRLVLERLFILDGYGNKSLTDNERIAMAKIEANNAFNSIKNKEVKSLVSTFSQTPPSASKSADFMIKEATGVFKNRNNGYKNFARPFNAKIMDEVGDKYSYVYIPEYGNTYLSTLDANYLIPLNSLNNDKNTYNGDFLMTSDGQYEITIEELIKLRESGNIFFSNPKSYLRSNLEKYDDGSTFIDIIDSSKYENLSFNMVPYGESIINEKSPNKINTILNDNFLESNLFNGKAGTTEILTINNKPTATVFFKDTETTPFFVDKTIKKKVVRERLIDYRGIESNLPDNQYVISIDKFFIDGPESYTPYIGFYADTQTTLYDEVFYSLFGSDLYYQQNNKGKAFLFLNCLPFNIDTNGLLNTEILSLFNTRASFVNVPYVWVLLIGAYIDRYESEYMTFSDNNFSFIPDNKKDEKPNNEEVFGFRRVRSGNLIVTEEFNPLDTIIKNFPRQVKDKFKKEFNDWVISDEFNEIINTLEIFPSTFTTNDRYNFWVQANRVERKIGTTDTSYSFPNANVNDEYLLACVDISNLNYNIKTFHEYLADNTNLNVITELYDSNENEGSPFNFHLELKPNSKGSLLITNLLRKNKVIVNSTWTIWNSPEFISDNDWSINQTAARNYLQAFAEEFNKLHDEEIKNDVINSANENNQTKLELFNATDSDDIKLNIYKKLKMIYDKWICGTNSRYEGVTEGNLYKTFKFIDRSYNDINQKLLINPVASLKHLNASYNQSFYSYLSKILMDNNLDFHALPAYINYNNIDEMEKVFTAYPYNESINESVSPAFICMYVGERSNNLDLDKSNFKNDGTSITFTTDMNGDKTINSNSILKDMQGDGDKIPIFLVNYGDSNQSIFTNISLNQAEFAATDESLVITDNLVNSRGIGQNLFDIYNSRAYSSNIEMLGNAMIQPMMYFQLSNIPMFHGLYTIIKVNHSIKPNSMTTTFTGSRIREVKTKMVDASTIFVNILGSLTNVDTTDASLNDLGNPIGSRGSKSGKKIDELSPYIIHRLNDNTNSTLGIKRQELNENPPEDYGLFPVIEYLRELGKAWYNTMYTPNPTLYPPHLLYSDISRFKGEHDSDHQTHDNGLAIDIRPLPINPNDYNGFVVYGGEKYSSERNMELFKFIDKFNNNPRWTPWKKLFGDRSPIEFIYFNDPNIISEFANNDQFKVYKQGGHNNHFHIKFNIPDKYLQLTKDPKAFIEEPITNNTNNDLVQTLIDLGYGENTIEHRYAYFIGKNEGYLNGGENSAPVRNNNPGNLTGVSEFKTIDPDVIKDPKSNRFAKFSSLDKGTKALVERKIIKWANGNYPATQVNGNDISYQNNYNIPQSVRNIAGKGIPLSIEQFFYIYAPPSDSNNTEKYISSMVAELNSKGFDVTRTSRIKDYLS